MSQVPEMRQLFFGKDLALCICRNGNHKWNPTFTSGQGGSMIRKLIALFVLFYVSMLFTGCNQDEIAEQLSDSNVHTLQSMKGSFVFNVSDREWRIFTMEFNRVPSYPHDLPDCEIGREHDGDFDSMYIEMLNGRLNRVEVKNVDGAVNCKVQEESMAYSLDRVKGELHFSTDEGEEGVRFIQEDGRNRFFVRNSKLEGQWTVDFDQEAYIGENVQTNQHFKRVQNIQDFPVCQENYSIQRSVQYVSFYVSEMFEVSEVVFGENNINGCRPYGTLVGKYEVDRQLEELKLFLQGDGLNIEYKYKLELLNQYKIYFEFSDLIDHSQN